MGITTSTSTTSTNTTFTNTTFTNPIHGQGHGAHHGYRRLRFSLNPGANESSAFGAANLTRWALRNMRLVCGLAALIVPTCHTRATREGAEADENIDVLEGHRGVGRADNVHEQVEAAVLELHLDAIQRLRPCARTRSGADK